MTVTTRIDIAAVERAMDALIPVMGPVVETHGADAVTIALLAAAYASIGLDDCRRVLDQLHELRAEARE